MAQVVELCGVESAPEPIPTGQVEPHLRPREHPRDRPQVVEGLARTAARGPGSDAHPAQLVHRADSCEPVRKAFGVDQAAVGRQRRRADVSRQPGKSRVGLRARGGGGGLQHGGGHLLQVTPRNRGVSVAGKYHLALLGDLETKGN